MKTIDVVYRENLALLIREHGTQANLSTVIDKSPAQISQWLNASVDSKTGKPRVMSRETARDIEIRTGKAVGWMDVDHSRVHATTTRENDYRAPSASVVQNVTEGPDPHGPYPLISEVQAGVWTELCDNFPPGDADEWMHSSKNLGKCGYLLRVKGKSMYAPGERFSFQEGMILHVNPDLEPNPGQFVIVRRESSKEATFKKYVLIEGTPYLEAINPDWPKEERYLKLQAGDTWCGVVVSASIDGLP